MAVGNTVKKGDEYAQPRGERGVVFAQPFNDVRFLLRHNFKRFEADDNQGNQDNNGEREGGEWHKVSFLGWGWGMRGCLYDFQAAFKPCAHAHRQPENALALIKKLYSHFHR